MTLVLVSNGVGATLLEERFFNPVSISVPSTHSFQLVSKNKQEFLTCSVKLFHHKHLPEAEQLG